MNSLPVRVSPQAERQVKTIQEWWRANREAAPELFRTELGAAFDLIGAVPNAGKPYRLSPVEGVRRVLLKRTRYHVYYRSTEEEVLVLAVWHTARGQGPILG